MNEIPTQQSSMMIEDFQDVLDTYINEVNKLITIYLRDHLILKHCFRVQLRHLAKDFFRNPINVLWAIPYFSVRKALEILERMGLK